MTKIVASAIKFYPKDSEYPVVVCGKRHCNCIEWMWKHQADYDKKTMVQGFVTEDHVFLDRYEAAEHAWANKQMLPESDTFQKMKRDTLTYGGIAHSFPLFSEDLW